ncbi:unnamed protein product [Ixodes pacificus]
MHECSRCKAPGHIPPKSPAVAVRWRTKKLVKVNKCANHRYWINSVDKPSTRQISLLNSDIFVTCDLRNVSASTVYSVQRRVALQSLGDEHWAREGAQLLRGCVDGSLSTYSIQL